MKKFFIGLLAVLAFVGAKSFASQDQINVMGFSFQAPWVTDTSEVENPDQGDIVFDRASSSDGTFYGYIGNSSWVALSPSSGAYALKSVQVFDSSNCDDTVNADNKQCTWTKPTDVTAVRVEVYGGGGGGATGATSQAGAGNGGAGGGCSVEFITSGLGSTEPVQIGLGGTIGAASGGGDGGTGGTNLET